MTTLHTSSHHRRRGTLAGAGLALMLLLGACGSNGSSEQATGNNAEPPSLSEPGSNGDPTPPVELIDNNESEQLPIGEAPDPTSSSTLNPVAGDWILHTLLIEGDMAIGFPAESAPTLSIEGITFVAFGGCQDFGGTATYDIEGNSFSAELGPLEALGPPCGEADAADANFFAALQGATTFTSEPGVLTLSDDAEFPTTMRFTLDETIDNGPGTESDGFDKSPPLADNNDSYVGLTLEDAQALAAENGQPFRVMHLDGEDLMGTADFSPDRINAKVIGGIVTEDYPG